MRQALPVKIGDPGGDLLADFEPSSIGVVVLAGKPIGEIPLVPFGRHEDREPLRPRVKNWRHVDMICTDKNTNSA